MRTLLFFLFVFLCYKQSFSLSHDNTTDLEAVLSFKSQVFDPTGTLDSSWFTNTSICNWAGISCTPSRQRVFKLSLRGLSLSGTISPMLGNLSFLKYLDIGNNSLKGSIPNSFGHLPRITSLLLDHNMLTGNVPSSIFNISLEYFSVAYNKLSGPLTVSNTNILSPKLQKLSVEGNHFTGIFPSGFSRCINLQYLSLSTNQFTGNIPSELHDLFNLETLYLDSNNLTGHIPQSLGNLTRLMRLDINSNALSGSIPYEIGQLKSLTEVIFEYNSLTGAIPVSMGNLTNLQYLWLAHNKLSLTIPRAVWKLNSLLQLKLSYNFFEGSIPSDIACMQALDTLDVASNKLSGRIPDSLGQLTMIEYMDLSYNSITSPIPASLGNILNVNYMNLSCNNLFGTIPKSLANLKYLVELNLSYNKLRGEVPFGGIFTNITSQYLVGNDELCGPPSLGLTPCHLKETKSNSHESNSYKSNSQLLKVILSVVASAIIFTCFCFIFKYWWHSEPKSFAPAQSTIMREYSPISYYELVRATQNFSESNLLGTGRYSSVYKGKLDNGTFVAIKVLNFQNQEALKTFDSECIVLGMVRHRNLVKVINACTNLNFRAIVLQFMPNGNLERWIHSPTYCLSLARRLNVALDVALGLEYLHYHHHNVVLHCDIKPSNVLLDEEMNARLSDFGISKIMAHDTITHISTAAIGTIGYMPPEYATTGRVSRKADVYSYGILLLEILTGMNPTDSMFEGELNLRQWVHNAYPSALIDVLDKNLAEMYQDAVGNDDKCQLFSCLHSAFEIALECTAQSPKERISMQNVVPRLKKIIDGHIH